MLRFLKNRSGNQREDSQRLTLGPLEHRVMNLLWSRGKSSVREVVQALDRKWAYTTVMTTLDRLFKKGLLERDKLDRAFAYSPRFSRSEWERRKAGKIVAGFFSGSQSSRDFLLSCFLDAVGEHDTVLLDDLEKKIRRKRKELFRRGRP